MSLMTITFLVIWGVFAIFPPGAHNADDQDDGGNVEQAVYEPRNELDGQAKCPDTNDDECDNEQGA